jgi:hypothetical protein
VVPSGTTLLALSTPFPRTAIACGNWEFVATRSLIVTRPASACRRFFVNSTPCLFAPIFRDVAAGAAAAASEPPATAVTSSAAPVRRDGMYFMRTSSWIPPCWTGTSEGSYGRPAPAVRMCAVVIRGSAAR